MRFIVGMFTSFFPKIQCLLSIWIMKNRGLNLDTFFLKTNHFDHRARDFQKAVKNSGRRCKIFALSNTKASRKYLECC